MQLFIFQNPFIDTQKILHVFPLKNQQHINESLMFLIDDNDEDDDDQDNDVKSSLTTLQKSMSMKAQVQEHKSSQCQP